MHIRNQLFYSVKCISDLRGNKRFLLCKTIVEAEEERECDVLEEFMKGQNNLRQKEINECKNEKCSEHGKRLDS